MAPYPFFIIEVIVDLRFKVVVGLEIQFGLEMYFVVVGPRAGLMKQVENLIEVNFIVEKRQYLVVFVPVTVPF